MGVFLQISVGFKYYKLKMENKKSTPWAVALDLVRLNVDCTPPPLFSFSFFFCFGQVISLFCQGFPQL